MKSSLSVLPMISRFLVLAILFAIPVSQAACADGERSDTAAIVEQVFRTGPVKSFMLQRDGEQLLIVR